MGFWCVLWFVRGGDSPPRLQPGVVFLLLAGFDDGRMSLQRWPFALWMVKIDEGL